MNKKQSRMLWSESQRRKSSLPPNLEIPQFDVQVITETLDQKKEEQKASPYNTRFDESCLAQLYS